MKPVPKNLRNIKWDYVTATDVVYHPFLFQPLMDTLNAVCEEATPFLLGYEERPHTLEFFGMLEKEYTTQGVTTTAFSLALLFFFKNASSCFGS